MELVISDEAAKKLLAAVRHVIRRSQTQPEFRWHMLGTETMDLVIAAESAVSGKPEAEVRKICELDLQPEYRKMRPECQVNREYIDTLKSYLEDHNMHDYPVRVR